MLLLPRLVALSALACGSDPDADTPARSPCHCRIERIMARTLRPFIEKPGSSFRR